MEVPTGLFILLLIGAFGFGIYLTKPIDKHIKDSHNRQTDHIDERFDELKER